jgi:hypothetical protein
MQKGGQITFKHNKLTISVRGRQIAKGYQEGNLFWIDTSSATLHAIKNTPITIDLWHAHMGHMSYQALKRYSDFVKGIALNPFTDPAQTPCAGCELRKQSRTSFPGSSKRSDQRLRIVHSDLAGPLQTRSIQGSSYIATFIDDYSRHGVVYFLKTKDQCAAVFKKFLAWAENQTTDHLLALHSDHGGEYISRAMRSILDQKGIVHKLTMPHSPQQNGVAERWNCTILDKARAMLHSAGLSLGFWECAVDTAVHTYNRTPTRTIGWHTPHKLWTDGHVPDVSYFRIFGCKVYVHTTEDKRKKLDPRSIEMTLIGYEPGSKGYRLWNSHTRSIVLSRDVTCNERSFPYKEIGQTTVAPSKPVVSDGPVTIHYNMPDNSDGGPAPRIPTPPTLPTTPAQRPTPERAETEFHTPLSQPAAATPPVRLHPQQIRRDPGVLLLRPLSYLGAVRPLMLPLSRLLPYLYLPDRSTAYTGLTSAIAVISMLSSYRPNMSTPVRTMPTFLFHLAFPRLSNHSPASCYESSPVFLVCVSQFFVYLLRLFCYLLSTILCISQPISKLLTHLLTVL